MNRVFRNKLERATTAITSAGISISISISNSIRLLVLLSLPSPERILMSNELSPMTENDRSCSHPGENSVTIVIV